FVQSAIYNGDPKSSSRYKSGSTPQFAHSTCHHHRSVVITKTISDPFPTFPLSYKSILCAAQRGLTFSPDFQTRFHFSSPSFIRGRYFLQIWTTELYFCEALYNP
ncbi:hypothetical protein AKJ16_DCAP04540, partial [Drosera capensis]